MVESVVSREWERALSVCICVCVCVWTCVIYSDHSSELIRRPLHRQSPLPFPSTYSSHHSSNLILQFLKLNTTTRDLSPLPFQNKYSLAKIHRMHPTHLHLAVASCRSFFAKEPLSIGLFCRKWPRKMRHPMDLRHPVLWWWSASYAYTCVANEKKASEPRYLVYEEGGKKKPPSL